MGQVELSFIKPINNEIIAPPTIEVDNSPDARVVYFPNPLTDKEKMVANMMELHNPTAIILHTAKCPEEEIESTINNTDITAQAPNTIEGFINCSTTEPNRRPINMLPQ